jgi:hypothetical protein
LAYNRIRHFTCSVAVNLNNNEDIKMKQNKNMRNITNDNIKAGIIFYSIGIILLGCVDIRIAFCMFLMSIGLILILKYCK